MSCGTFEQLAAAAAGEDPATLTHAAMCDTCRALLEEQREVREVLGLLAPVPLTRAHREQLTAEVMARADEMPPPGRRRLWTAAIIALPVAAAVILVILLGTRTRPRDRSVVAERGTPPAAVSGAAPDKPDKPDKKDRTPQIAASGAAPDATDRTPDRRTPDKDRAATVVAIANGATPRFTRATRAGRDVVDLVEGAISVDARDAEPVEIVATAPDAGTRSDVGVRVVKGKIAVTARRGVIKSITVFAGSAEVTSAGRRQRIEAGTIWDATSHAASKAEAPGSAAATPAAAANPALDAFRDGWTALRAGRHADAMAAFDRATDPTIAEDAAYWAAIAAERMGDRTEAARRLTVFLASFPQSGRAAAARLALEKLAQ